jgi:hypothetical protein
MFSKETEELFFKVFGVDTIFRQRKFPRSYQTYHAYCRLMRIQRIEL